MFQEMKQLFYNAMVDSQSRRSFAVHFEQFPWKHNVLGAGVTISLLASFICWLYWMVPAVLWVFIACDISGKYQLTSFQVASIERCFCSRRGKSCGLKRAKGYVAGRHEWFTIYPDEEPEILSSNGNVPVYYNVAYPDLVHYFKHRTLRILPKQRYERRWRYFWLSIIGFWLPAPFIGYFHWCTTIQLFIDAFKWKKKEPLVIVEDPNTMCKKRRKRWLREQERLKRINEIKMNKLRRK